MPTLTLSIKVFPSGAPFKPGFGLSGFHKEHTVHSNAFIGKTKKPTDAELAAALGPANSVWEKLVGDLAAEQNLTDSEWHSYAPKHGWFLRITRKKRNIIYLSPCEGKLCVTLILGGKAMKAAYESDLPARAVKLLKDSKKYPEGNVIYIDVKGAKDIPFIKKLTAIKLAN